MGPHYIPMIYSISFSEIAINRIAINWKSSFIRWFSSFISEISGQILHLVLVLIIGHQCYKSFKFTPIKDILLSIKISQEQNSEQEQK